ncbi:MAG: sensor histidine kinase, partial [Anaerolineae bacterium]
LLRQIITNLVTNAIKYSPKGSKIDIVLSNDEHDFSVIISDNGIGIPDKDQVHIFDPFHRATNARDFSGTGLGLAITKKAVEKHNGEISFTSIFEEGTSFCVSIPLSSNNNGDEE